MDELTNIENLLNLTGIMLEIVGFALLLSKFREWIRVRHEKKLTEKSKESEGAYIGPPPDYIIDDVTKTTWNFIESFAIPLVLFGLAFQGLSLFIHS